MDIYMYKMKAKVLFRKFEDADSIPSRKALELHFTQVVPVWVL